MQHSLPKAAAGLRRKQAEMGAAETTCDTQKEVQIEYNGIELINKTRVLKFNFLR